MVTWGVTDAGVGSGGALPEYRIDAIGWSDRTTADSLSSLHGGQTHRPDIVKQRLGGTVTGKTERLSLPATAASCQGDIQTGETTALDDGLHTLTVSVDEAGALTDRARIVTAVVQFRGPARVTFEGGRVGVDFPERRAVTITVEDPTADRDQISVAPTPEGVARGLTTLAATHETESPARSHPAERPRPPLLTTGDETGGTERSPDTGIRLTLPRRYQSLFVAAPLAYYLGATVETASVDCPRLRVPSEGVDHHFRPVPAFQQQCASLLRAVFYFDCLLRESEPGDSTPLLAGAGLDAAPLRDDGIAGRLARYLQVDADTVDGSLPEWHLSTYVRPGPEHVSVLPHLLDDMSLVYLPSASELTDSDRLEKSLSENYRSVQPSVSTVDVLDPQLRDGAVHGWLAEGTPVGAYKSTPAAYHNRGRYRERPPGPLSVTVVLNDESMSAEQDAVAGIYRDRAGDLPMDVTVREQLSTGELAREFQRPTDFLHYIGHCEPGGLRCPNGTLETSGIEESRTRTFFLNGCGSYHEGLGLVERGSMAGAVTLRGVLDEQAATVGTAFARLVMHGFTIERAMQLARRRVLMSQDYAVVGDGTAALLPVPGEPGVIYLQERDDRYAVSFERVTVGQRGRHGSVSVGNRSMDIEHLLPENQLKPFLESTSLPVIYEDRFHWSSDLVDAL